ncbi:MULTISPECIES: FidL-like protein [Yersinia]|uniref:Uncharacterized protein n=1 Tax=Yersinia intermedia TaxID=631 RepID=A0A0T9MYR1_YERIN|nr:MULTISPECIES: FidL-like protein [Yersinia]ARB86452.1 hypothetical protein A6J67_22575 [Yersinia sp. FDAARGOS_228]AVL36314.1 hypothetical protein CEQ36_12290 [Yersinia intermedia]CNE27732.1 Uncharacterised protein [Yersinia intermedia]CNG61552.1 Uncharacterised protein [Yersinia intermedia]
MKKKNLTIMFLVILMMVALVWVYLSLSQVAFKCYSELNLKKETTPLHAIELQASTSFFFYRNGSGFIKFTGTVDDSSSQYVLNRMLPFKYSDLDNDGIYTINFIAQKIRAIDDVPEDLWSKFIETGNDNMPYYINLENISKNIYMINGLASPIMVCSSEQN